MPAMIEMSGLVSVSLTVMSSTLVIAPSRSLAGRVVEQRAEAAGHRIAFGSLVAPAGEVEDHVVGGERVAIVPGRALAHMQHIFGGVVIDFPALEQGRLEGELRVYLTSGSSLPRGIGDFRPVVGARVLLVLDRHGDPQHAALVGACASAGFGAASPIMP